MNIRRFLISLAARRLSQHRLSSERERIKAKARQIREEIGLPPAKGLEA